MEAVPRLPMISFDMLICTKKISFTDKIEKYISGYYHEDPSSYHTEIQALNVLRVSAVWPSVDISGCQAMKKYYCQLHYMKSRFPMEENQPVALQFSWKDEYTKMSCTVPDVGFEEMCILFNIGALHSKLGATDTRSTSDGMKMACTHFQCAAWTFQKIREQYAQYVGVLIASIDIVRAMELLCLAQAQECILEKSLLDNRKAAVVVKVAAELSNFYFKAHKLLVAGDDVMLYEHLPQHKYLVRYVQFKVAYYRCLSLLYAGQQAEEQQHMGSRVAYYQAALDSLEEARDCIGRMPGGSQQQASFSDTITFTWDVVEGKRKAAVNENEFIYHEEVPQVTGPGFELKGASLVKGIAFSVTDVEISGADIFARLIPMVAHEASSIYSEQKASLLRHVANEIEEKDQDLQEFMSAINVDFLNEIKSAKGLTQELVDRAADMNSRPEALSELVQMMSKLSDTYHEVESLLSDVQILLQKEGQAEAEHQSIIGNRPQSNVLTELRRETAKYQEAHSRASESNDALHKAMTSHISNLKMLAQPLNKLQEEIPNVTLPSSHVDEEAIQKLEIVLAKVDELKTQRATLWTQFTDEIHKDNITPLLVTTDLDMDDLFKMELKKHKKLADLIKQNIIAQENIKNALTNSYAALNDSRKYIEKILHKRNITIAALNSSYDTYGDLKAKVLKGIEFYTKLETNVTKLYQRVRSTCKVQQEEREQLLMNTAAVQNNKSNSSYVTDDISNPMNEPSPRKGPKLKDYLDTRRTGASSNEASSSKTRNSLHENFVGAYYPGVRPTPVGADSVATASGLTNEATSLSTTGNILNQNLDSKMAQLTVAQKYWNDSPGTLANLASYDNTSGSRYNTCNPVVNTIYDLSNASANFDGQNRNPTYISSNISGTLIPATTVQSDVCPHYEGARKTEANSSGYNTVSATELHQDPLNKSNTIADSPSYPYNIAYGTNAAKSATPYFINSQYPLMHCKQQVSVPTNIPQSNNADQIPYNYYPPGYNQAANNPINNTHSVSVGVTGNTYNSSEYSHIYPSYNLQPTIISSTANVNATTPVQQPNLPVVSSSNYYGTQPINQIQHSLYGNRGGIYSSVANQYGQAQTSNITSALITPQPTQYTPVLTNNTDNLPISSTQTATTTATTISPNNIPSQGITSSYVSPQYINQAETPIKSHALSNFGTDSNNYGHQPNTNYYANYMCQTTPANNYYNYSPALSESSRLTERNDASMIQKQQQNYAPVNKSPIQEVPQNYKKVNSIDLLAGLDFSVNQAPLLPQTELPQIKGDPVPIATNSTIQPITSTPKPEIVSVAMNSKKNVDKPPKKEPFRNSAIVTEFTKNAQEFWSLTDSLVVDKTLNNLWKEVQNAQDSLNIGSKSISVGRCYPLKNRCPDILPYDYSRIELIEAKDDYINASKVYDLHESVPNFIVTQTPLKSTLTDFWDMVWERDVETVVCLLSDNDIGSDIYWPTLQNNDLHVGNKIMTLQNTHARSYSIERKVSIHIPEKRETKYINLYQFTSWTGSVIPANSEAFLSFAYDVSAEYDTQKSHLNPILVHCNSGVGRSGCFCTVLSVMGEVNSTGKCADIKRTISLMSAMRKNILRDREHLKFTYSAIALFYKDLLKVYNSAAVEHFLPTDERESSPYIEEKVDPLSALDPLWATKK